MEEKQNNEEIKGNPEKVVGEMLLAIVLALVSWPYYLIKWATYMFLHKVFWRTLYLTGLARTYSIIACKYNFYSKFHDGRCQWCGAYHEPR